MELSNGISKKNLLQLSDHFTYAKLLRFTLPSIVMLVVTSIYYVVDGLFVSNFVGKTPFTAINFIWPYLQIMGCFGFMFGAGGGALISKTLGEQKRERANDIFSMLIAATFITGVVLTVISIAMIRPVAIWLGATDDLLEDAVVYGWIYLLGVPACLLQYVFQYLCATAEKPKLALYVTLAAGISNIVLDAIFIVAFSWGVAGAAIASVIGQSVGGFIPLIYFGMKNSSLLRLKKTKSDRFALKRICANGASELLNNISFAVVGMLYNIQLMRYIGPDGVAAYGILMYVNLIFIGVFIGYSVGVAPVIGYHYGAQNYRELNSLLKKSTVIIGLFSIMMLAAGELLAKPLSMLYAGYDPDLYKITLRSFYIYSFSFLFAGYAVFSSSFFTALNNGLVSAIISFLRTLVFELGSVLLLPLVLGLDGIWCSVIVAEFMATVVGGIFLIANRNKYHYF